MYVECIRWMRPGDLVECLLLSLGRMEVRTNFIFTCNGNTIVMCAFIGTLVLVASDSVIAFSTRTGQVKWEATLEGSEGERVVYGLYSDGRTVYAVSVVDSSIIMVTQFNSSNGASLGEQQLPAPWFSMESDRYLLHIVLLSSHMTHLTPPTLQLCDNTVTCGVFEVIQIRSLPRLPVYWDCFHTHNAIITRSSKIN